MPYVDGSPDLPPASRFDGGSAASGPPGNLLHPSGPDAAARRATVAPLPDEAALERDADRLLRLLTLRTGRPQRWTAPAFAREVELVRGHLRPIRSRELLAASFGREAFHGRPAAGSDVALGTSAVRVAYALRWLELGDGGQRDDWRALIR